MRILYILYAYIIYKKNHDLKMAILLNYSEKLFKPSNRATGSWLIDCLDPI